MAELNYVKKNLHYMKEIPLSVLPFSERYGGNYDSYYQVKKTIIDNQERRLKKALATIEKNRQIRRSNRVNSEIPSVAIVGYTNSGKTSLIKALTLDSKINPEDRLFATLDVTTHAANLSPNFKALLIDTIGFISEMPIHFIHCFKSTLSEICFANVLVHVIDSSHPDKEAQIVTVHDTLKQINVPEKLLSSMIIVNNKIDKVDKIDSTGEVFSISTTKRIGLDELKEKIEKRIVENTDRIQLRIR